MLKDIIGDILSENKTIPQGRHTHQFILDVDDIQIEFGAPYLYKDIVDRVDGVGSLSTIYATIVLPIIERSWNFLRSWKGPGDFDIRSDDPEICELVDNIITDIDIAVAKIMSGKRTVKKQTFISEDVAQLVFILLDLTYRILSHYLQERFGDGYEGSLFFISSGCSVEAIPRLNPTMLKVVIALDDDIPF